MERGDFAKINLLLVIILLINLSVQIGLNFYVLSIDGATGHAVNEGYVDICINYMPEINASFCSMAITEGDSYSCLVNATDDDGDDITFSDNSDFFEIGLHTGLISFTAPAESAGDYNITVTAEDNSGCNNKNSSDSFILVINEYSSGGGTGGGSGGGGRTEKLNESFEVKPKQLNFSVIKGKTSSEKITLTNKGNPVDINARITNLQGLSINDYDIDLGIGQEEKITAYFDAKGLEPGVYTGEIFFESLHHEEKVIVVVEVEDEDPPLDIIADIKDNNEINAGDNLSVEISVFTMGNQTDMNISMNYSIQTINGSLIWSGEEARMISVGETFIKVLNLPYEISDGDYVLGVKATYNDISAVSSGLFHVGKFAEEEKEEYYEHKEDPAVTILEVLALLALITALFLHYRKGKIYRKIKNARRLAKKGKAKKAQDEYNKIRQEFLAGEYTHEKKKELKEEIKRLYEDIKSVSRRKTR